MQVWIRKSLIAGVPAGVLVVVAGALWWVVQSGLEGGGRGGERGLAFAGWVLMVVVVSTLVTVVSKGAASRGAGSGLRGAVLNFALVADAAALLLLFVGVLGGHFGWREWLQSYLVLVGWLGLCTAVAWWLRGWGTGVSVGVTLVLAGVLMGSPIVLMPLVRAAAAWGPAWQDFFGRGIAVGCPLLGMLEAIRPSVNVPWGTLPGMYRYSGLNQDPIISVPAWWVNAVIYGGLAGVIMGMGYWRGRRRV